MKAVIPFAKTVLSLSFSLVLLAGCAAAPKSPDGAANVRQELNRLQADAQLAVLAPLAIKDAEQAVRLAEQPEKDTALAAHRLVMAERKVTMASTQAQTRQLELQRDALSQRRDDVRLNARTREAANARADANEARNEAEFSRSQANSARADASSARQSENSARLAENAATDRENAALSAAASARRQANAATATATDLREQIAELNARPTDRGLVVTLGDVLFDTGKASLKNGSSNHLDKLALFLNAYPTRTAQIEGHTDDVGADGTNMRLSQRRAETVKAFLVAQGVAGSRLDTAGKGEAVPLAANTTAGGRAQNRRVEVIIANAQQ